MKAKIVICCLLILGAGWRGEPLVMASMVSEQVLPGNLADRPVTVQSAPADFGRQFTVFLRASYSPTDDKFIHGQLTVNDADHQIATIAVEKTWRTNGVTFEFTVAASNLLASKFSVVEEGHIREMPMPSVTVFWFYLRDFAPSNSLSAAPAMNGNPVPPEITKAMPGRLRALRPGMTANEVWERLRIVNYEDRLGGEYSPDHDHIWLNWNSELEFYYEPPPANRPDFDRGNRKFIRAILLKNGLTVAESRDK